ncbi:MAG: 4Fe-4S dicluster domain-containing protein [Elusimicrobiota bacterium]|jgi:Ni,Fe-hydrogenase III small subunit/ferredoxin
MLKILWTRLQQKHRTTAYPKGPAPELPPRFLGRPKIDMSRCTPDSCRSCAGACPHGALDIGERVRIDLGKCLFCGACEAACPAGVIEFTREYRMAVGRRGELEVQDAAYRLAEALDAKSRKLFGHSLKLRQVSAGGCGACEADVNVLNTVGWDLGRFGIQFVASPRHADGLLVTGPVTENMRLGLLKTWEAVPSPKLVIAAGACAISGGPYLGHPEVHDGCTRLLPVDLFIPGCPPHPLTVLDGLLRLLGRLEKDGR